MVDKGMITTSVDDLVRLVRDSGKVSVADAAKKLGIAEKTVQMWVDFLVEEERLSIEYKFTTPYIFLNKDFIDEEEELSISKADFETEIKREEITIDEGEGKFHQFVSGILNQFKNIQQQILDKKLDGAYDNYNHLSKEVNYLPQSQLADIFNRNLIQLNYQMLSLYKEELDRSENIIKDIISKQKSGEDFIQKEELEQAKKTYKDMKSLYDSVPTMLVDQREHIYDIIYIYFKKILAKEKQIIARIRSDSENKISHIKSEINRLLHEDKIHEAEKHLVTLKDIYFSLPSELISFKLLVYNEIIRAYEEVRIARNFEGLRAELDTIGSKIKLPPLSELMKSPLTTQLDAPYDKDIESPIVSDEKSPATITENAQNSKNFLGKKQEVELSKDFEKLPSVKSPVAENSDGATIPKSSVPLKGVPEEKSAESEPKPALSKPLGVTPIAPVQESNPVAKEPNPNNSHNIDDLNFKSESLVDLGNSPEDLEKQRLQSDIEKGMREYHSKNYESALKTFDGVLTSDKDNAKAKQMKSLIEGIISAESKDGSKASANV